MKSMIMAAAQHDRPARSHGAANNDESVSIHVTLFVWRSLRLRCKKGALVCGHVRARRGNKCADPTAITTFDRRIGFFLKLKQLPPSTYLSVKKYCRAGAFHRLHCTSIFFFPSLIIYFLLSAVLLLEIGCSGRASVFSDVNTYSVTASTRNNKTVRAFSATSKPK